MTRRNVRPNPAPWPMKDYRGLTIAEVVKQARQELANSPDYQEWLRRVRWKTLWQPLWFEVEFRRTWYRWRGRRLVFYQYRRRDPKSWGLNEWCRACCFSVTIRRWQFVVYWNRLFRFNPFKRQVQS